MELIKFVLIHTYFYKRYQYIELMVTRDMVRGEWNYEEKYLIFARKKGSQGEYSFLNDVREPFQGHDDLPGESRIADITLYSEKYAKSLQEYLEKAGYETLMFTTDNKGLEHLTTLHLYEALSASVKDIKTEKKE